MKKVQMPQKTSTTSENQSVTDIRSNSMDDNLLKYKQRGQKHDFIEKQRESQQFKMKSKMLTGGNIGSVGHKRSRVIDDRGRNTTVEQRFNKPNDGPKNQRRKGSSVPSSDSSEDS